MKSDNYFPVNVLIGCCAPSTPQTNNPTSAR